MSVVALRPVEDLDLDALFDQMRDPASVRMAAFTTKDPGDRSAFDAHMARVDARPGPSPDELTDRLLRAAGARVTAVDVDELGPEVTVARIELATPAGPEHVTARLLDGLAAAIISGAPIRVAHAVMDRLAVPAGPARAARCPSRPRVT